MVMAGRPKAVLGSINIRRTERTHLLNDRCSPLLTFDKTCVHSLESIHQSPWLHRRAGEDIPLKQLGLVQHASFYSPGYFAMFMKGIGAPA